MEQRSKGFEAEIIAIPVKALNVITGYGYNDAKYTRASEGQQNLSLGSPKKTWLIFKEAIKYLMASAKV